MLTTVATTSSRCGALSLLPGKVSVSRSICSSRHVSLKSSTWSRTRIPVATRIVRASTAVPSGRFHSTGRRSMATEHKPDRSVYTVASKGIVAYGEHDWRWENLLTREPSEDEFLVELIATGVCHTDITGYGGIYPRVLGHEGAGRIVKLGSKAQEKNFAVGDLVILSAASCQNCHYCDTGHPAYCQNHAAVTLRANEPAFVLESDKSKVIGGGYFGQSSFASPTCVKTSCASNVSRGGLVKDAEELKRFAPLGCGIMTGAGAITHVSKSQPDDVVGIVGLGGVGLAGVCAAKKQGVKNIVAVDLLESRVNLALGMGATAGVVSNPDALKEAGFEGPEALQEAIKAATPGKLGCSHILDTSPSVAVLNACMEAAQSNGTIMLVGVKRGKDGKPAVLELDLLKHMVSGKKLAGVIEGDRDPAEALPELVQWCKEGVLPVEKLLKEYPVQEYEKAREVMEKGEVIKAVLVW